VKVNSTVPKSIANFNKDIKEFVFNPASKFRPVPSVITSPVKIEIDKQPISLMTQSDPIQMSPNKLPMTPEVIFK
jgi:hypothetical protein